MSSLFEIGFSLLLPLIISFFFVLMTRSIFSVLAFFFQLVMGFNKGIPKSFNLPDLLGAPVKSWSPSHCFIMKSLITMSKKGTETPLPLPEGV